MPKENGSIYRFNRRGLLRERYIGEFSVPASEKGTAFRRTSRSDLNWIFPVQTERVVEKDNTVAIKDRWWQIDKTRFRNSLAGSTVTIHDLDETVSIRYGPQRGGRSRCARRRRRAPFRNAGRDCVSIRSGPRRKLRAAFRPARQNPTSEIVHVRAGALRSAQDGDAVAHC